MTPTSDLLARHATDGVCYLQTTGRVTGRPRTIEMWFATDGRQIYLLAGGRDRAHWVRNLRAEPRVRVRIGGETIVGQARVVEGEEAEPAVRRALAAKYQGWREGMALSGWARGALPVVITPDGPSSTRPARDGGQ